MYRRNALRLHWNRHSRRKALRLYIGKDVLFPGLSEPGGKQKFYELIKKKNEGTQMKTVLTAILAVLALSLTARAQYEVEWSYQLQGVGNYFYASSSLGSYSGSTDYNGDGIADIVIITASLVQDHYEYINIVVDGSSHQELFHLQERGYLSGAINLDNDPEPEFIYYGSDFIEVRSGVDGTVEWTLRDLTGISGAGSFVDIDNDNRIEFLVSTVSDSVGTVYVYGYPGRGERVSDRNDHNFPREIGLTAGPNPFNSNTIVRFVSESQSEAELTIVDQTGRILIRDARYQLKAGENNLPLSAILPGYDFLPGGAYILRINANGQQSAINLVKLP